MLGPGADNLHFLPVVGHFFAAVKANYIGSGGEGSAAARALFHSDGKTVAIVGATEQHIQNPGEHPSTSTESRGQNWGYALRLLLTLDSVSRKRVRLNAA